MMGYFYQCTFFSSLGLPSYSHPHTHRRTLRSPSQGSTPYYLLLQIFFGSFSFQIFPTTNTETGPGG
ncbi:hypothetical protein CGRA01v4_06995 [Colletotrichum graminicola]|nr:hypothetical protein CGRA01v4_06995 [Colletotrichum graminicola]